MHSRLKLDIGWRALFWAAAGAAVSPERGVAARARLQEAFGGHAIVIGLSVRTIFDALLIELGLPAGSPVLMSGVNIQNMADIVQAHGLRVRAVDLDLETLTPPGGALLQAQADTGAKLCLVTQLFGSVSDIADAAVLRQRGVLVVEDAAQAFAGDGYHGAAEVDVSLFSFGPIKRRTALGGAVGVFRDPGLAARIQGRLDSCRQLGEGWFRRRAFKYLILKSLSSPGPYAVLFRLFTALGKDPDKIIGGMARGFSGPSLIAAIRARPPARLIALLADQVGRAGDVAARQAACQEILDGLPQDARVGAVAPRHAFWLLPILSKDADGLIGRLRRAGFDATRGATSLRALAPADTPAAHALMAQVVYLPHPIGLDRQARRRLREATAGVSQAGPSARPG